jgi:predicted O-linked N-acetylglucosamine transferase (SPINDLY family)
VTVYPVDAGGALPPAPRSTGQTSKLRLERTDLLLKTAQQLTAQARLTESRDLLLYVVDREPENADAYLTLAIAYEAMGCIEDSVAAFHTAVAAAPDNPTLVSASAFACDRDPEATLEEGHKIRRRFNEMIQRKMPPILPHTNLPAPDRPLRIGYVSGDLRHHSASKVFGPVLLKHDPKQFEVCAYMTSPAEDWLTETLKAGIPHWRDASIWGNEQLYAQIRADQIDILVDLSGHSAGNRLAVFARKPAPVQVTAWGYITGTGLDAVDYMFADEDTIFSDEEQWFSEKIVRLPRIVCYWPTDPSIVGPVAPLPCLQNGYMTYGVVNRIGKLKIQAIELWARILAQVPDAKLIVKAMGMEHPEIRAMVQDRFESFGTNLSQLQFRGSSDSVAHQQAFNEIDVGLDPWPDGGGVSTLEALWMGVPTVTLPHRQIASRLTTSFQKELGLPWLSASSADEYVERAVALNSQRAELAWTRKNLRDLMCSSALCDTLYYVRSVEAEYRKMWRYYCDQKNGVAVAGERPHMTLVAG